MMGESPVAIHVQDPGKKTWRGIELYQNKVLTSDASDVRLSNNRSSGDKEKETGETENAEISIDGFCRDNPCNPEFYTSGARSGITCTEGCAPGPSWDHLIPPRILDSTFPRRRSKRDLLRITEKTRFGIPFPSYALPVIIIKESFVNNWSDRRATLSLF